jgi:hypothetical protein
MIFQISLHNNDYLMAIDNYFKNYLNFITYKNIKIELIPQWQTNENILKKNGILE